MSRAPNIFLAVSILSVFISTVVEISFVYILHPANRTASRRVASRRARYSVQVRQMQNCREPNPNRTDPKEKLADYWTYFITTTGLFVIPDSGRRTEKISSKITLL